MATKESREMAAHLWCRSETAHIVMDVDLAEEIATEIDKWKDRIIESASTSTIPEE